MSAQAEQQSYDELLEQLDTWKQRCDVRDATIEALNAEIRHLEKTIEEKDKVIFMRVSEHESMKWLVKKMVKWSRAKS